MQQNRNYCKLISKTFGKFLFHVLHPLNSRCITLIISIQKGRWEFEEKKHKLFEIEIECVFAAEMIVRAVSWPVWFHVNVWEKTHYWKTFWCDLFVLMYFQCWNVVSSPWNTKCVVITTMGGQATTICWAYKLPRLWEKEGWKRISPNVWLMEKLVQFHRLNFPPGGISKTYFYFLFTNCGRPNDCFPIWIIFLLISEKKENKVSLSSVEEQKQKEALRFQDIYRESASK